MATSRQEPLALQEELAAFEAHRAELVGRAAGKYALVHHDRIIDVFDTESDAIRDGYRQFGNVPFLVKRIEPVDIPQRMSANLLALP